MTIASGMFAKMMSTAARAGRNDHCDAPPPARGGRIAVLASLALLAGLGVTVGLARLQHDTYRGFLQAKSRTVTAGRAARIAKILVQEGAVVRPGAPLLLLSDLELEAQHAAQLREIAALEAELAQVHAKSAVEVAWRKQQLEAEIFETKLRAAGYLQQQFSHRLDNLAWEDLLEKSEPLASSSPRPDPFHTISLQPEGARDYELQVLLEQEAARNALEVSTAQLELCNERLTQLEQRLQNLPEQILEALGAKVVQARLDQARAELTEIEQRQQALTLTAETYGLVGVFLKGVGDDVGAQEAIVELLDEDRPYLLVQIPPADLADFSPGTELELRFPGGIRGKGRVESIPPQVAPLPGNQGHEEQERLVHILVAPAGRLWPRVPFGSAIEVRR